MLGKIKWGYQGAYLCSIFGTLDSSSYLSCPGESGNRLLPPPRPQQLRIELCWRSTGPLMLDLPPGWPAPHLNSKISNNNQRVAIYRCVSDPMAEPRPTHNFWTSRFRSRTGSLWCTTRWNLWKCWPSDDWWRCTGENLEGMLQLSSLIHRGASGCRWWATELWVQENHRWSDRGRPSHLRAPRLPASVAAGGWSWLQKQAGVSSSTCSSQYLLCVDTDLLSVSTRCTAQRFDSLPKWGIDYSLSRVLQGC